MSGPEQPKTAQQSSGRLIALLGGVAVLFALVLGLVLAPLLLENPGSQAAPAVSSTPSASPTATPNPTATGSTVAPAPLDAPLRIRVLFAHQALGAEISKNVPAAYSNAGLPKPRVAEWKQVQRGKGAVFATATIGRNGSPRSKLKAFAALVNNAPRDSIDLAVMAFNYQDITAETDVDEVFGIYVDTMESVEMANPDVAFLYSTVPVTAANSWREEDATTVTGLTDVDQPAWQDNIARERFNALVRERYAGSGRLFDIAALQANLGNGKVAAKKHGDQWYYVMNPQLSPDGKLLNSRGAVQLARSLMMLVAAVAKA